MRLSGITGELERGDRVTSRSVAEAGCAAGAPTGCALAGDLWLPKTPQALPPPGTFQLEEDIELTATKNAAALFDRGCSRLSPRACSMLGVLLVDGLGIQADPIRGEELLRWGCERGIIDGCRYAGLTAERMANYSGALELYRIACDKGDGPACRSLGHLLDEPLEPTVRPGVKSDEPAARALYEKACQLGDKPGCTALVTYDALIHPIERTKVEIFEILYEGRTEEEAQKLAQEAVDLLGQGTPLAEVAAAHADPISAGSVVREERFVRTKISSPLQDVAFALAPGSAVVVADHVDRLLVVFRDRAETP